MGLVGLVLALTMSACSSGSNLAAPAAPAAGGGVEQPSAVFVAIGGAETLNSARNDIQDNWPQIVFAEHLPAGTLYVNLATDGATAASAGTGQVAQAAALHPTVAVVWVETADVKMGTPPAQYQTQLRQVVTLLQAAGAHQVLLLSPSAAQPDMGGGLAASVQQVATDTGAVFVDLGDTSGRQDDAGQRRIADAVMAALGPSS